MGLVYLDTYMAGLLLWSENIPVPWILCDINGMSCFCFVVGSIGMDDRGIDKHLPCIRSQSLSGELVVMYCRLFESPV